MALVGRVPEVVEAGVVERRRRLERRDVPAQLGALLVGAQHRRDRVPPVQRADAVLELEVTGMLGLLVHRDGVHVGGGRRERHRHGVPPGLVLQLLQQERRPVDPVELDDGVERLQPFLGLARVLVLGHLRSLHCTSLQTAGESGSSLALSQTVRWHAADARPPRRALVPAVSRDTGSAPSDVPLRTLASPIACGQRLASGPAATSPSTPRTDQSPASAMQSASGCARMAAPAVESRPVRRDLMAGCRTSRGSPSTRPGGAPR